MGTATVFAPHGLAPARRQDGAVWGTSNASYRIGNAYATSIYSGDPVWLDNSTGTIKQCTAGTPVVNTSTVPIGIFMGCQYIGTDGKVVKSPYWPASTALLGSLATNCEAYVLDDPSIVFRAQFGNGSGAADVTTHTLADLAGEYNFDFTNAGSTATGLSAVSINFASKAATAKQVRLVRYIDRADMDYTGGSPIGEFVFAFHTFRGAI